MQLSKNLRKILYNIVKFLKIKILNNLIKF